MNRTTAEAHLKEIFGFDHFFDDQWSTIEQLLAGKRVLLIEKTGFGKSLCFQFPATQFDGVTVIFSPLIALMRDQVRTLNKVGIKARFINSEQSPEENSRIIREAVEGTIKILYIAPERQENREWLQATRKMKLSMIVIDEAHTISVWGHDFRPAFRRIINLVKLLPKKLPVLATTATATPRVQEDIEKQISGDIVTYRGNLMRSNFKLHVIEVKSEDEKYLWLAENLEKMEGTGLIYTGTRVNTDLYARWLEFNGINATYYNAGLDPASRKEIETGLMDNRWKAVVSTNALGMGIDKPDIRFIIHTQIPASPIHYYQEIGRAGRDGNPSTLILFYNSSEDQNGIAFDYKLPKAFIEGGRPGIDKYQRAINALMEEPLGERQLSKAANLKTNQVRVIKADLIEQGIIREVVYGRSKKYEYQYNAPQLDVKPFQELRSAKFKELKAMVEYVFTTEPRMKFLCDYLGDDAEVEYTNCDNSGQPKLSVNATEAGIQKLEDFRETFLPVLEVVTTRKVKGRSVATSKMVNGVAGAFYWVSNVGEVIERSKYAKGGDYPDFLIRLTLKAYRKKLAAHKFDWVLYVPSTESDDLLERFAVTIASILDIPLGPEIGKRKRTKPQRQLANGFLKKENVANAFYLDSPLEAKGKKILLIDDVYETGATVKEIGSMLSKYGATLIAPLVIAKKMGG